MSIIKQIIEDFNSTFIKSNVDHTVKLFTNFKYFMSRIESGTVSFSEALCFAILVSISMSFIGELAMLATKVDVTEYKFRFASLLTLSMIIICGISFRAASAVFGGRGTMLKTISGFCFVSLGFILIRLLELPAMLVRYETLLTQSVAFERDVSVEITQNILNGDVSSTSNWLVTIGYVVLAYWTFRMLRIVESLSVPRAISASLLGLVIVGAAVHYIQNPIVEMLVLSGKT